MMVPWSPGGATDIQISALCEQDARHFGQPIIVESMPGGGGYLAANLQALLVGDIHFSTEASAWADMAIQGCVRPFAVWMRERATRFPDVATLREIGYDVLGDSTYGIGGPRGMDPGVVRLLHDALQGSAI
jgi:tripartite-type tricarboxylate transporter receptor subunit TctC